MDTRAPGDTRRSFWAAFLVGVALMAGVDEIIFHQLLAWHHFYDRATPIVGLVSDGFLHAAELIALVTGFLMFFGLCQANALVKPYAWAGGFLGAGIFQVFDGIVDHKLLRLHQIRYDVDNLLMYDLAWNGFGLILILIGVVLLQRARKQHSRR